MNEYRRTICTIFQGTCLSSSGILSCEDAEWLKAKREEDEEDGSHVTIAGTGDQPTIGDQNVDP